MGGIANPREDPAMANPGSARVPGSMLATTVAVLGLLAAHAACAGAGAPTKQAQIAAGKALYAANCASCHQADGSGQRGVVPPLAGSDFLAKGTGHAIAVVLHGLRGQLQVHGRNYDSAMPPLFRLDNEEVADVLTYVYNSWGNPGGRVRAREVARQRYDRSIAPRAPTGAGQ